MTQVFDKPGKTYRKVKDESITLPDEHGKYATHRVPIYMASAGTPHFAVKVPLDYANAWAHHKDAEADLAGRGVYVVDGVLKGDSYQQLVRNLEAVGGNFHRHISNVKMRKVISLALEITGGSNHRHLNSPSFSGSRILVGIRSGVYWEVNGSLYAYSGPRRDGRSQAFEDLPDEDPGEPKYQDMHPAGVRGNHILIDFTPEAWATVQQIEASLIRAADMLLQLAKPEDATKLLQGGLAALAALPAPEKE